MFLSFLVSAFVTAGRKERMRERERVRKAFGEQVPERDLPALPLVQEEEGKTLDNCDQSVATGEEKRGEEMSQASSVATSFHFMLMPKQNPTQKDFFFLQSWTFFK